MHFGEVKILSRGECEYEIMTIGATRGTLTSSSGVTITPDRTIFDPCPQFDTVILPGGLGVFDASEDTTLTDWLVRQASAPAGAWARSATACSPSVAPA